MFPSQTKNPSISTVCSFGMFNVFITKSVPQSSSEHTEILAPEKIKLSSMYCGSHSKQVKSKKKGVLRSPCEIPEIIQNQKKLISKLVGSAKKHKEASHEKDEEEYEKLYKKVKVQEKYEPTALSFSALMFNQNKKQEEIFGAKEESESSYQVKDEHVTGNELSSTTTEYEKGCVEENLKSKIENCSDLNVFYDEKTQKLLFKLTYIDENFNEPKMMILTRDELVQYDSKLMLYFYENHLQFTNTPHFEPQMLKRL